MALSKIACQNLNPPLSPLDSGFFFYSKFLGRTRVSTEDIDNGLFGHL